MNFIILVALIGFIVTCDALGQLTEDQLVVLPHKYNYDEATRQCASKNLRLVKVNDIESNELLFNFAVKKRLGKYWIDGNNKQGTGRWVDSEGNMLSFTKWAPGEPNYLKTERCIEGLFFKDSSWNNIGCDSAKATICYDPSTDETPGLTESQLVVLRTKASYEVASCLCSVEGMKLVKIEDPASNTLVYNFAMRNKLGKYWMDGNDKKFTGRWTFNDGCKMTYTNWYRGEPNYPGVEQCLEGAYYPNGLWNNIKCSEQNAIICYKENSKHIKSRF